MKPEATGHRTYWCRCGQKLRVPLSQVGHAGDCPGCGARIHPTLENTLPPGLAQGGQASEAHAQAAPAPVGVPTPPPVARYTVLRGAAMGRDAVVRRKTADDGPALDDRPAEAPPHRPSPRVARLWRERERLCAELGARVYEASDRMDLDAQMERLVQELARCERRIAEEEGAPAGAERRGRNARED
jgi:hypothetical protein